MNLQVFKNNTKGISDISTFLYRKGDEVFRKIPQLRPFRWLYKIFGRKVIKNGVKNFESKLEGLFERGPEGLKSKEDTGRQISTLTFAIGAVVIIDKFLAKDESYEYKVKSPEINYIRKEEMTERIDSSSKGTSFDAYIPLLKKLEGGWSDSQSDRGGKTMKGVTLKTFRAYFGEDRSAEDLANISESQWRTIMISFWNTCKADLMINQSVAEIIVDWAVNSGPVTAIKGVQSALGVKVTGRMDQDTLDVINSSDQRWVFDTIKQARVNFYNRIVENDPNKNDPKRSQRRNLKGWLNRLSNFHFVEQPIDIKEEVVETTSTLEYNDRGIVNKQ